MARANSSNGTARIVTQTVTQLQERLQEIDAQRTQLREMRANGSISQAEYQARLAALATRTQQLERLANRSHETARGLPAAVRERNQVDLNAIDQVRTSARNMSAGEMSTAARSIAGNGPKMSRPETRNPGQGADTNQTVTTQSRAEARIQTAERVLDQARNQVQRAEDGGVNPAQARETLNRAEAALEDAEAALESGDGDAAADNADEAIRLARQAGAEARNALATGGPDMTTGSDGSQTSPAGPPNGTNVTTGPQVTTDGN
ncbi:SHOCT domain-containing protein [Halobacteriaceae archaeon GCM10025711]